MSQNEGKKGANERFGKGNGAHPGSAAFNFFQDPSPSANKIVFEVQGALAFEKQHFCGVCGGTRCVTKVTSGYFGH